jgi:hypothetical protein
VPAGGGGKTFLQHDPHGDVHRQSPRAFGPCLIAVRRPGWRNPSRYNHQITAPV